MNSIATSARWACRAGGPHRRAFTLTELLFVMMILAILAALSLSALSGATQQARIERTRAIINRLDKLITEKYDSYRTRAVPIRIPPGTDPRTAAQMRLRALRELMRMEMPNNRNDVLNGQDTNIVAAWRIAPPALWKSYVRRVNSATNGTPANWTVDAEGAECLYLIIASMRDGEDSALDFFAPSEIGDTDNDGMQEILDAFGMPVNFIRWPYGYASENPGNDSQWGIAGVDDDNDGIVDNPSEILAPNSDDVPARVVSPLTRNSKKAPDPFDPLRVDSRWLDNIVLFDPYDLKPLVYSAGPDRVYEIQRETRNLTLATPPATHGDYNNRFAYINDPYVTPDGSFPANGTPWDADNDGSPDYVDNITNHDFSEK